MRLGLVWTDATNVVKTTVISVFAEIGMDHMGFLGNTVEEIAAVKAGIIKPGTIAVSARSDRRSVRCCKRPVRKRTRNIVRFENPISKM